MRTIEIKLKDPNIVLLMLPKECVKNCEVKDDSLFYKLEKEHTYEDNNFKHFLITLASYIYPEYVSSHLVNKKLSDKEMKEYTALGSWPLILITLKLEQYFQFNDILNEEVFYKFNLASLGRDIDKIYNSQEAKKQQKKDIKAIRNQIKKMGLIDINDYKTVSIDYDTEIGIIIYSQKEDEYLTLDNMQQKLGVGIKTQTIDQWQLDLTFCLNCLLILNVKKIIIDEDMYELIEDLEKNTQFSEMKIKVEVIPSDE